MAATRSRSGGAVAGTGVFLHRSRAPRRRLAAARRVARSRRVPQRFAARPRRPDRLRALPELRRAGRGLGLVSQRLSSYDSTTKAVPLILDGMARARAPLRTGAVTRARSSTCSSAPATACSPPRRPRPSARLRCAAAGWPAGPAILPNLMAGRPERFRRWVRSIGASRRAGLLDEAPADAARALPLPALGRAVAAEAPRPAARHEHRPRLPRRVPHPPQRAALPAPARLHRPSHRNAAEAPQARGHLRRHADRGDRRPRLSPGRPAVETRRSVSHANVEELAPVPLFVKRPGQRRAVVSATYARTLDVPSTIADVLGLALGYRDDGRSAFSAAARRQPPGVADRARLLRARDHLRAALERAAPPGGGSPPARLRLRRPGRPLHRHRPQPPAVGPASARASRAPAAARRRGPASPSAGCSPRPARLRGGADAGRRRPARRRRGGRPRARAGGQRPHRGRRALLPPQRRADEHFALNVPEECAARGPQPRGAVRGGRQPSGCACSPDA